MRRSTFGRGACVLAVLTPALTTAAMEKMSRADKRWLEEEVAALITEEEIELFRNLESDEERGIFKRIFWIRRDPTPDTRANELKDSFENRLRIVKTQFKEAGREGSATERGLLFLLLGPPLEWDSNRTPETVTARGEDRNTEGRTAEGIILGAETSPGQDTAREGFLEGMFPETETSIQTWVYPPNDALGIPDGLTVRFRVETGLGYRLVRSKALEQTLELVKIRYIVNPTIAYERDEQGSLLDPLPAVEADVFHPTNPVLMRLRETRAVESDIPFRVSVDFFRSADNLIFAPMVFDIDVGALGWERGRAHVAVAGLVEDGEGNAVREFDETTVFTGDGGDKAVFEIPLHLAPGRYTIYLGVLDTDAMRLGTQIRSLEVPALSCETLETSSVLLFSEGQRVKETVARAGRAFVIGGYHFVPKLDTVYQTTGQLSGVFQACGYGLRGGQPHLTAQYSLLRDGVKRAQTKDEPFISANGETAITVFDIPLRSFESGKYLLRIEVRDRVKNKLLTKEIQFEIQ